MSIDALIARLGALDVSICVKDAQLRVTAPPGVLTRDLRDELKARKEELLEALGASASAPIQRGESGEAAPLTFAQERIWLFQRLEPESAIYNMQILLELQGTLDRKALSHSLDALVERHDALRSRFFDTDEGPVQRVAPPAPVCVEWVDLTQVAPDERRTRELEVIDVARRVPFRLDEGPLLRATVIQRGPGAHALLMATHHIVVDGASLILLVRELAALYRSQVEGRSDGLPALPIRYSDYARWQRGWAEGPATADLKAYWGERLGGDLPVLELPTDRPRDPVQSYRGGTLAAHVDLDVLTRVRRLAQELQATPFAVLLAAFKAVLYRHGGEEDLIVGVATLGREKAETRDLIGMFVNTIAIRTDLGGEPTFRELARRVKEAVVGGLAHGELPFEKVLDIVRPRRDRSRTPVFQVLFNAFNVEAAEEIVLPGLRLAAPDVDELLARFDVDSKFDLTMYSREAPDGLRLQLVFNADLFARERMCRLLDHYSHFLTVATERPDTPIGDVPLAPLRSAGPVHDRVRPDAEKAAPAPDIAGRFRAVASRYPGSVAVQGSQRRMTYGELDALSDGIAGALRAGGGAVGERIGVVCDPEPELFAALIGVLKAGLSFVPLDPLNPRERLERMAELASIRTLLTDRTNAALARGLDRTTWLVHELKGRLTPTTASPGGDREAYVLFTSGSTGVPKGVLQSRENLLRHAERYAGSIGIGELDRVSLVSSYGFDAALMDIFGALLTGAALVPVNVQQHGVHKLRDGLLEHGVTVFHSTPTVFRALLASSQDTVYDSVRAVVLGGEAVYRRDVDAFRRHFPHDSVFVNGYGPSESTTALQQHVYPDTELDHGPVPLGCPVGDTEVLLVDRHGRPASVVGEIAIKSRCVALGYLGRPELTAEAFLPVPGEPSVRVYRTGDVAFRRPDGTLVFRNRRDGQVKLRGYRIELGELESLLEEHPSVAHAVGRLDRHEDTEHLVAFVAGRDGQIPDARALRLFLIERVPSYMLPSRVVPLPELPLTSTGKVDRVRLPEVSPDPAALDAVTPPRDAMEEEVASVWREVLGRTGLGIRQDFFELGGNSLQATQVVARLGRALGRELSLRAFFDDPTIAGVADRLKADDSAVAGRPNPVPVPRSARMPLSFSQERMWFIQRLAPETTAYNMGGAAWLDGPLDESAMERAWLSVVQRHESLRTRVVVEDGVPSQTLADPSSFAVEWADVRTLPAGQREDEARRLATAQATRPFDLEGDSVLRVLVVRVEEDRRLLAVVVHHVAADLWSLGVIGAEVLAHYNALRAGRAPEVRDLPIQYPDFAVWQRSWLKGDRLEALAAHWRQRLAGVQPLDLPTDRPRHQVTTTHGSRVFAGLSDDLVGAIRALAARTGTTSFMVLLAAFDALLARYTGQADITVGVPIANRTHKDLEGLVGTFVNTLALRTDLSGDPTFVELLARVRDVALDAYQHQDMPFERLVTELNLERDMTRAPLIQVLFNVANAPVANGTLDGLGITPDLLDNHGAQFDLGVSVLLRPPARLTLTYNPGLHDRGTAEQICRHYVSLLEEAARSPDSRLSELRMLSDEERARQVDSWNRTATDYPRDATFISLFEDRVRATPDRVAIEVGEQRLTYAELDRRAEVVARALRARGVAVNQRVAVLLSRGVDMVASLLGVMKSGAAYVPLDPAYPSGRLEFVLVDSGVDIVLTHAEHAGLVASTMSDAVLVESLNDAHGDVTDAGPAAAAGGAGATDPAYVIYTSGSTGRPKGVAVPHRALVNFLFSMAERPGLTEDDVLAAVTTVSFDIAGLELYLPLLVGARIALLSREEVEDPYRLMGCLERAGATVMQATPATWRMLVDAGWTGRPDLKALCGGEALPQDLVGVLLPRVGELWNMYGPTETTIWSTTEPIVGPAEQVTIGRPIANTRVYVLDTHLRPVPVGAAGEIYIGGEGVALGYHGRPELTAERFVPDPFGPDGGRMYRTGDLGRLRPDGRMEHLGRLDHQVKIRGFRIELGEIEAVLASHPAVQDAVTMLHGDRLVAYVAFEPGRDLTVTEIRSYLREDLPAYMIPAIVVPVDALPLTPNGKVDRRALPDPYRQGQVAKREYVEPDTPLGRAVAEIWSELLGVEAVGAEDNFFDLGGHSLLAMQAVARVEERTGRRLDPRAMFFQTLGQIVGGALLPAEPDPLARKRS